MRIAFFTDTFLPETNGVAITLADVARGLAKQGHDIMIVAPKGEGGKKECFSAPRVRVLRLPSFSVPFYGDFHAINAGLRKCLREMKTFRPDIVHVHSIFIAGGIGRTVAWRFKVPLVGTNHIYVTADDAEFYRRFLNVPVISPPLARVLVYWSFNFHESYDTCIVPSEFLGEGMRASGYTRPIVTIPNPVNGDIAVPGAGKRKKAKKALNLKGPLLLHVGRLSSEKSVDVVLRAFAATKNKDAVLIVVGDGLARPTLQTLAKTLGIAKRVRFTGLMSHDDLLGSDLYLAADLFVTASTTESQGMAAIEAMAFGLPLIGVSAGALPEMFGKAGILVAPGDVSAMTDAMDAVLRDPAIAVDLREKSQRRAKDFSLERSVDSLLSLYATVTKKR